MNKLYALPLSILFVVAIGVAIGACDDGSAPNSEADVGAEHDIVPADTGSPPKDTLETPPDTNTDTDTDVDLQGDSDVAVSYMIWTAHLSMCGGSKMDALLCDDASTCYSGCGSNAEGDGLWMTTDGGASWDAPEDEVGGFFEDFRVVGLHRGSDDGLLYVSGTMSGSDYRVVSLDTSSGALGEVYNNIPHTDFTMTTANYVRTSDGSEYAESLTGTQLLVRKTTPGWTTDNDGWAPAYGWWHSTSSDHTQVLDMTVVDDQVIGVGSTISKPPAIYLPPRTWGFATDTTGDGYLDHMWETVILAAGFSDYSGECWGVGANADGLSVACVNQDDDLGMIYTIGSDWEIAAYDANNWTGTDVSGIVSASTSMGHSTWSAGTCRGPDNFVAAVGRDSQTDDGWVITSKDGGETWTEHTSDIVTAYGGDFGPVIRCQVVDGTLVVGGSLILASAAVDDL